MARTELTADTTFTTADPQSVIDDLTNNYDLRGYNVTIQITPGVFNPFTIKGRLVGQKDENSLLIIGDTTTPSNVESYGPLNVQAGALATIKGVWVHPYTSPGIVANDPGTHLLLQTVWLGHQFLPIPDSAITAGVGSRVQVLASVCRLRGNCQAFIKALGPSQGQLYSGVQVVLENNPDITAGFLMASEGGLINSNITWSGTSATGRQASATLGSKIYTAGSYTSLPGSGIFCDSTSVIG